MNYGEMIGRNNVRMNEAFVYVSNDAGKRQAIKKNYFKAVVTDMQNFLRMEDRRIPIYVDEYLPELNSMVNRLGARIVHVPRNERERMQSVDYLGNKIFDEAKIQRGLYEKNKKEQEENEKRQQQARMDKLKDYLIKNYPMYADEQCKYVLSSSFGGYDDESIKNKVLERKAYFIEFFEKSSFYSPGEKEEKKNTIHRIADEFNDVRYNDILSDCIHNGVFMEAYLEEVGGLFLWNRVKPKVSMSAMSNIRKEMIRKIVPQEIRLYRVYNFVRNGITTSWNHAPFLLLKHQTETVDKIRNALN